MTKIKNLKSAFHDEHVSLNPFSNQLSFKATELYTKEYRDSGCGIRLPKTVMLDQVPHTKVFITADLRQRTMGLSKCALQVYMWFIFHTVNGKDYTKFNRSAYMREAGITSPNTVKTGINELIRYEFIAETAEKDVYWINPLLFFCGDRLKAFPNRLRVVNEWTSL